MSINLKITTMFSLTRMIAEMKWHKKDIEKYYFVFLQGKKIDIRHFFSYLLRD